MEVDRENIERALDEIIDEMMRDADNANASIFVFACIPVIGRAIKGRLVEKLFGGKE